MIDDDDDDDDAARYWSACYSSKLYADWHETKCDMIGFFHFLLLLYFDQCARIKRLTVDNANTFLFVFVFFLLLFIPCCSEWCSFYLWFFLVTATLENCLCQYFENLKNSKFLINIKKNRQTIEMSRRSLKVEKE